MPSGPAGKGSWTAEMAGKGWSKAGKAVEVEELHVRIHVSISSFLFRSFQFEFFSDNSSVEFGEKLFKLKATKVRE